MNAHAALSLALQEGEVLARRVYAALSPEERLLAASLALHLGRPHLAAEWGEEPLLRAAAGLRLGQTDEALDILRAAPPGARQAVLHARALWQQQSPDALPAAQSARRLARREADQAALIAAVTLLGELSLATPHAALRTLAEGLKVAEVVGQEADAHLLAVLAHAQLRLAQSRLGGGKGLKTALKALERSQPRSPARVLALLALGRAAEAQAEAQEGALHEVWWQAFTSGPTAPS